MLRVRYIIFFVFIVILFNFQQVNALDNEYLGNIKLKTNFNSEIDGFALNTVKTSDGGYLAAINGISSTENKFLKIDSKGNVLWKGQHCLVDILETSSGNIFGVAAENVYLYNSSGELQKKINFELNGATTNLGFPGGRSIFEFGDNYVIVGIAGKYSSSDMSSIVISTFDSSGNQVNNTSIDITKQDANNNNVGSFYGTTQSGNKLYLLANDGGTLELITVDKNLEIKKNVLDTSSLNTEALENISQGTFTSLDVYNDNVYFATSYGVFEITGNKIELKLATSNSEINGLDLTSMVISNDMIIVGGLSTDSNSNKLATVVIYDLNFNKLDIIIINDIFDSSATFGITKGLKVQNGELIIGGMFAKIDDSEEYTNVTFANEEKAFVLVYKLTYNIKTKTDGNGTITTSTNQAFQRDEVTFTVTPNEGYELDYVTIVDSNGNEVIFKDNNFAMPNANVIITAKFKKSDIIEELINNPPTGMLGKILIVILMCTLSLSILFIINKKMKKVRT